MVECALRDDPGAVEALHRTTDDRDLEQRKARRQLLLGMVVAVAVASLLQVAVLRTGAPMDFMARYAAGGLVDRGRSPYDRAELLAAERKLWPGVGEVPFYDPPPTAAAFRLVSRLPLNEAALAWKLLSVICLVVIGLLLTDLLGIRRWTARLTIIGLLTLFGPVRARSPSARPRPPSSCRCSRPSGCACADPRPGR